MKIGLLYTNKGEEDEISRISTNYIEKQLLNRGYEIKKISFSPYKKLDLIKSDVIFNLVYGRYGEDGLISLALDQMKVPYIGPSFNNCLLTHNKLITKQVLTNSGIPTPKLSVTPPCIYKPIAGGSSGDVIFVRESNRERKMNKYTERNLISEEYIDGKELCITAIKKNKKLLCLPIAEIVKKGPVLNSKEKYRSKGHYLLVPAKISTDTEKLINTICQKCYSLFDCKLFIKIDIILGKDQVPYVIEIDGIPGFGPHSIITTCARSIGIEAGTLFENFIHGATKSI